MLGFAFVVAAAATTYNVTVCAEYDVTFSDADASFGDDYVTTDGTYPARGARIKVVRNRDGATIYDGFALESGASAGCAPSSLLLDSDYNYSVKVKSYAQIDQNTIYVYTDDINYNVYSYGPSLYSPSSSGVLSVTTPVAAQWNIAMAAGYAMYRFDAGLSAQAFEFINDVNGAQGTIYDRDNDWVYVSPAGQNNKYMIAHEFGHMVAARANGAAPEMSYAASKDNCYTPNVGLTTHSANQKEYQSAAVWEGIAHYYSVLAFNSTQTSDCTWVYYKNTDWNLDLDPQEGIADFAVTCETGPTDIPTHDYLGAMCTGTLTNRGTEYDWLRFFWDITTDQGLTYDDVLDIWVVANTDDWLETDASETGKTAANDRPAPRLRNAANTLGFLTEWDAEDDYNGVHR